MNKQEETTNKPIESSYTIEEIQAAYEEALKQMIDDKTDDE